MKYKRRRTFGTTMTSGGRVGGGSFYNKPILRTSYPSKPGFRFPLNNLDNDSTKKLMGPRKWYKNLLKARKKQSILRLRNHLNLKKSLNQTTNSNDEVKLMRKRGPYMVNKRIQDVLKNSKRTVSAQTINNSLEEGLTTRPKVDYSVTENFHVGTNPSKKVIPTKVQNKTLVASQLTNVDGNRYVHKTVYETGFRPSKSNLLLAKQFGVETKLIEDSKVNNISVSGRDTLTAGSGFNLTQFHVPSPNAQLTFKQMRDNVWGTLSAGDETNQIQQRLMSVLNIKQQYLIKNQSANFPMDFTIHLVRLNKPDFNITSLARAFEDCFHDAASLGLGTQTIGKIPRWFQDSPYTLEEPTTIRETLTVSTSNKIRSLPRTISNFKNIFTIVESFKKTIPPGEYWNFVHIHNCGKGIDSLQLARYTGGGVANIAPGLDVTNDNMPYTLGVIFQVKGRLCEAIQVASAANYSTFIGTSPTFYMYEYRLQANFVRDPNSPVNGSLPYSQTTTVVENTGPTGTPDTNVAQREFRSSRANYNTASVPLAAGNIGKYFIPFTNSTANNFIGVPGVTEPSSI